MLARKVTRKIGKHRAAAVALAALLVTGMSGQVFADVVFLAPETPVKKVVNGKFAVGVDNGWVIYQGLAGQPTLNFYDSDTNGTLKLKTAGFGQNGVGLFFMAGGIVFAPCPVSSGTRCATDSDTGEAGVGIGFGLATFGGAGGAGGGWVNDSKMIAHLTNPDQSPGNIVGLAVDPTNGAFAVGWDLSATSFTNHAILWQLDSATQTYAPQAKIDLGTLGGPTSQALAISRNAKYVAGIATDAANKGRAVYALTTDTGWTDIQGALGTVIKSRALAASNTGFIAGSATVKRTVAGKNRSVDIGFVYNTADATVKIFEAPGYKVIPLRVLDDGRVVGNLELIAPGSIKANHPFLFDGTNLVDFGTMVLASTGQPAFGCRVTKPNSFGELVGSCIPDGATPYGVNGAAFYLDAASASPAFIDVNAAVHANVDDAVPTLKPFKMGTVTAIDDQHEITFMGFKMLAGSPVMAAFLATKPAYNP
ncbi:MAG TPA: hypothetical protein VJS47_01200 [Rhizomicrobium sp.]|nr:hypothetical protein [Rhizomicrobium sp.]